MRKTKIAAIVAAAAVLVLGMAFTSMAAAKGWVLEEDGWTWQDADGERVTNTFKKDGNDWFYLNDDGVMAYDSLIEYGDNNDLYYVGSNGARVTSKWVSVYNEDDDCDYWYFFAATGKAVKGKKACPVDNTSTATATFLFDEDCHMLTGWVEYTEATSGNAYSAADDDEGLAYESAEYYCDDNGQRVEGDWRKITIKSGVDEEEDYFYFGSNGLKYVDVNSNKKIGGKRFSFDSDGVMAADAWVIASGAEAKTAKYYDANGYVKTGWFQATEIAGIDEDTLYWFHADKNGNLAWSQIFKDTNGKQYLINDKGQMESGLWWLTFTTEGVDFDYSVQIKETKTVEATTWNEKGSDDEDGLYYFGNPDDADTDGALKTGEVSVVLEDDNVTMSFATKGNKGRALDGLSGKKYYAHGIKLAADADDVYQLVYTDADGDMTKVKTTTAYKAFGNRLYTKKGDLYGFGTSKNYYYKDAAGNLVPADTYDEYEKLTVFNTSGAQISKTTKTDGNDYKIEVDKDGIVTGIYVVY